MRGWVINDLFAPNLAGPMNACGQGLYRLALWNASSIDTVCLYLNAVHIMQLDIVVRPDRKGKLSVSICLGLEDS